jgi:hypothetical protein
VFTGDPLPPGFVESSEPSWKSSEGLGPFLERVQSAFLSLESGVVLKIDLQLIERIRSLP